MGVPRAKKPKYDHCPECRHKVIRLTNELNFCVSVRTLAMVYDWTEEQFREYVESYTALLDEIADGRCSVRQFVRDTIEMTGIDPTKVIDEVYK